jgi:capsule polysaccharide export protein KpsE/RkpR
MPVGLSPSLEFGVGSIQVSSTTASNRGSQAIVLGYNRSEQLLKTVQRSTPLAMVYDDRNDRWQFREKGLCDDLSQILSCSEAAE